MSLILLVDDSAFMRKRCTNALVKAGYEVCEASNGRNAISVYEEKKPSLVFMDITMPGLNGMEALKQIIQIDKKAKVVMLSALGQQGVIREAIKHGAKYFIEKPFDSERMLDLAKKFAPLKKN